VVTAVSVAAQSLTKFRGSREPTRRHSSVKVHCLSSNSSNRYAKKFEFSFSNDIYLTWFQNTPEGY